MISFIDLLAKFWNVVTLVQPEPSNRDGHGQLPAFPCCSESSSKFLNPAQEELFVHVSPASVVRSRVFPVEIETVESIFEQKS